MLTLKQIQYCSEIIQISEKQVDAVQKLLFIEKCTIPFIARYRKEATGNLNETQIRQIEKLAEELFELEKRREFILEAMLKMEVLTEDLKKALLSSNQISELEELYAPFKSKKKTKASVARENGLEPLALLILDTEKNSETLQKEFVPNEKVKNFEDALSGVQDILIEKFTHQIELKKELRDFYKKSAIFQSEKRKECEKITDYLKFKDYFEFSEPMHALFLPKASHRFLAMSRGEELKVLKLSLQVDKVTALQIAEKHILSSHKKYGCLSFLKECIENAFSKNIHHSLHLEFLVELKKKADEAAIKVFGTNLKNLLLAPYLGAKTVMGIDPGVRTGCKVVVMDATGNLLLDHVVFLQGSQEQKEKAKLELEQLIEALKIEYIAIGDGTFGRETLRFIEEEMTKVKEGAVKATLISEAGASVYSASEVALEEFPNKDVTVRGAISIARRFQDPLSELVKIDPKSIGVGQYQHDVNETRLKKSLEGVVEDCVNYVGVDLNTASQHILKFISGIGPSLAKNIIEFRSKKGRFTNRKELLSVPRFSEKIYEQSVGFLRVYEGNNILDRTFVHPENYSVIQDWCADQSHTLLELISKPEVIQKFETDEVLKNKLGEHTFFDIVASLKSPSQDPRTVFKSTEFNKNLKSIEDLQIGAWYTGVVNNITNFGAFVNIGIKESGLVHVSQLSDQFVEDPLLVVKVGQELKVRVIEVDKERKRVALTCKKEVDIHAPSTSEKRTFTIRPKQNKPKPQKPKESPIQKRQDPPQPLQTSKPVAAKLQLNTKQGFKKEKNAPLNNAFAALKDFKVK